MRPERERKLVTAGTVSDDRVVVLPDDEAVGRAVAGEILDELENALATGRDFVLGCPGGRTPVSTYRAMAEEFGRRRLDLSRLVIAMMDDYLVPGAEGWERVDVDAHFSCRRFAREEIQAVFNRAVPEGKRVPDSGVWVPDPADPEAYEELLAAHHGIDFFILASGAGDGHIAFNPPGTERDSRTRIVELAEQTRRDNLATFPDFASIDEVPTHGITVGTGTIVQRSRRAAMIAVGAGKAHAVGRLIDGDGYDPSWPATIFREIPDARLYVDDAAAAGLGLGE
jgi:glucosamine-6-phosphate deaminase